MTNIFNSLDASVLTGIVNQSVKSKEDREAAQKTGGGDWIPTAYLPAGKHKVRLFCDPEGKLYRPVKTFNLSDPFKRIMDPRFFKNADGTYSCGDVVIPDDVIERTWQLTKDLPWQKSAKFGILAYCLVLETDSPSDNWKVGTLYILNANGKFEEAWMGQITSLAGNPKVADEVAKSLNPTQEGWAWEITRTGGAQGTVTMTPTLMIDHPAVADFKEDMYKPLADQYVKHEFKPEDFRRLETQLTNLRIELKLDEDTGEGVPTDTDDDVPADGTVTTADNQASTGDNTVMDASAQSEFLGGATTTTETKAEVKAEVKPETSGVPEEGTPEAHGLNKVQMEAALASGMTIEAFAKMMNIGG